MPLPVLSWKLGTWLWEKNRWRLQVCGKSSTERRVGGQSDWWTAKQLQDSCRFWIEFVLTRWLVLIALEPAACLRRQPALSSMVFINCKSRGDTAGDCLFHVKLSDVDTGANVLPSLCIIALGVAWFSMRSVCPFGWFLFAFCVPFHQKKSVQARLFDIY